MFKKYLLYIFVSLICIAGIAFPIVPVPQHWWEYPLIPGLEENAKIIFFHVPTAWITVVAFLMSAYFGFRFLKTRDMVYDAKAYTANQLGMVFCFLATVTGSVWAKFNWGSFWNWDPRETSIFILLLIYGALFALRSAVENEEKRATLSAAYSLIAFVTVPFLIFIMPRIMKGLHPGSADDATSGPIVDFKMNANMRMVFYLSLTAFTILYGWMWSLGYRSVVLKDKLFQNK